MQVHHPRKFLWYTIGAMALTSCNGPEYQLGPHGVPSDVDSLLSEDTITSVPELEFDRTFSFGDGARTPVADYLFVVDDSVSMEMVLDKFRAGFVALADSDVFPEDARIGVMNTTPADYETLRAPHAAVRKVG
ncbi:MAG: hypothetical protein QGG40_21160, partial [Myxococcota bacterium]|nr:hypothetical protein [Myxococcota bacterium]